ncbi:hypothetical protein IMY05_C3108000900 [Salix suchowensis]|nr:hypothetical protein IMY05_C3108000900 [Salix suchowensis]
MLTTKLVIIGASGVGKTSLRGQVSVESFTALPHRIHIARTAYSLSLGECAVLFSSDSVSHSHLSSPPLIYCDAISKSCSRRDYTRVTSWRTAAKTMPSTNEKGANLKISRTPKYAARPLAGIKGSGRNGFSPLPDGVQARVVEVNSSSLTASTPSTSTPSTPSATTPPSLKLDVGAASTVKKKKRFRKKKTHGEYHFGATKDIVGIVMEIHGADDPPKLKNSESSAPAIRARNAPGDEVDWFCDRRGIRHDALAIAAVYPHTRCVDVGEFWGAWRSQLECGFADTPAVCARSEYPQQSRRRRHLIHHVIWSAHGPTRNRKRSVRRLGSSHCSFIPTIVHTAGFTVATAPLRRPALSQCTALISRLPPRLVSRLAPCAFSLLTSRSRFSPSTYLGTLFIVYGKFSSGRYEQTVTTQLGLKCYPREMLLSLEELSLEVTNRKSTNPNENPFDLPLLGGLKKMSIKQRMHALRTSFQQIRCLTIGFLKIHVQPSFKVERIMRLALAQFLEDSAYPRMGIRREAALGWANPGDDFIAMKGPMEKKMLGRMSLASAKVKMLEIPKKQAKLLHRILGEVILTWPVSAMEVGNANLSLINGHSFYREHVEPILRIWERVVENSGGQASDWRSAKDLDYLGLRKRFEYNGHNRDLRAQCNTNLEQALQMFFDVIAIIESKGSAPASFGSIARLPPALTTAVRESKKERLEIKAYFRLGVEAFRNATWIRCPKVSNMELDKMKGKVIVESTAIVDAGIASGAFEATDCIMVDESWIRISRPGLSSQTLEPLIFWAPDDETDNTPMESKIFGGVMYGANVRTNITSAYGQSIVQLEMRNIINSVLLRENIKRGMMSHGTMVKSYIGKTSTSGVTHSIPYPVGKASENSRPKRLQAIKDQQSLRIEITRASPGFHIDNDDTITEGWVSGRSNRIKPDESNFAWANFKLLVELEPNAHWIWDARAHYHGTSMNRLCAIHPSSWKTWAKDHPEDGQWTRVNVITRSTALAAKDGR